MNRGDIWLIDLGGKTGTRPAVGDTHTMNEVSRKVVLALELENCL